MEAILWIPQILWTDADFLCCLIRVRQFNLWYHSLFIHRYSLDKEGGQQDGGTF